MKSLESKYLSGKVLQKGLEGSLPAGILRAPKVFQWLPITSISHASTLAKSPILLQEISDYALQIEQQGFDSAIIVKQLETYQYEIILGYKLFFAANLAGLETIPAIVITPQLSNTKIKEAILEELNWSDLDDIETAKAYELLLESFHYTHDELAHLLQISRPVITNQLRMLQLPIEIQRALQSKTLTKSQCHLLLRLSSTKEQLALATKIQNESLSVRQIEAFLKTDHTEEKERQRQWKQQLQQHFSRHVHLDSSKNLLSFSFESPEDLENLITQLLTKRDS